METREQNQGNTKWVVVFEKVSFFILLFTIFLLPLFVLPFGVYPVDFQKAMFLYFGASFSAIIFLSAQVYRGRISVPKSPILLSLSFVLFAWLFSTIFSTNVSLSLFGGGYESGTSISVLFMVLVVTLVSLFFRNEERHVLFYFAVFFSALILFALQFLHTVFGVLVPPWEMFRGIFISISGDWYDLGIFFGLVSLIATSCLSLAEPGRKTKIFLWFMLVASLSIVYLVNFSTTLYVLGFVVLAFLAYRLFTKEEIEEKGEYTSLKWYFPTYIPFLTFIVIFAFVIFGDRTELFFQKLGILYKQFSPSWMETLVVLKETLFLNPILGSGPNTFFHNMLLFKPETILGGPFWDLPLKSSIGKVPTFVAETGILGTLALLTFFGAFLYSAKEVILYKKNDIKRMFLATSFFSALYLWVILFVHNPGFLIFALATIFTGIFVASLGLIGGNSVIEIDLERKTKRGIVKYVLVVFIILGLAYSIFAISSKYFAGYLYTKALNEANTTKNLDKAATYLSRAIYFDPQDIYFRTASEASLLRLGEIIRQDIESKKSLTEITEKERENIRASLISSVQYAKDGVAENRLNPENWVQLGHVYEAILSLGEKNIKDSAVIAYSEALSVSPKDPRILLALARVEYQTDEKEKAFKYIDDAIKMKSDFTPAHIMLANIKIADGRTTEGISVLQKAVAENPNGRDNIYLVFYIGTLYYNNGDIEKAVDVFEKLVSLNNMDVDSIYYLGLSYGRLGMTEKAITQFEIIDKLIPNNEQILNLLKELRNEKDASYETANRQTEEAKVVPPKKKK